MKLNSKAKSFIRASEFIKKVKAAAQKGKSGKEVEEALKAQGVIGTIDKSGDKHVWR